MKFTYDWFNGDELLNVPLERKQEIHILEIGSLEGKSTIWFIENFLSHPKSTITCVDPWLDYKMSDVSFYAKNQSEERIKYYENFLINISETGQKEKVKIAKGFSNQILPKLTKQYDLIYIDGNHTCKFVLEDSVLSFLLLKHGGFMVWDDYEWTNKFEKPTELNSPKLAIDCFLKCYASYLKIFEKKYKVIIKKL
jgi:predicted O-methyltransferase YrrM